MTRLLVNLLLINGPSTNSMLRGAGGSDNHKYPWIMAPRNESRRRGGCKEVPAITTHSYKWNGRAIYTDRSHDYLGETSSPARQRDRKSSLLKLGVHVSGETR